MSRIFNIFKYPLTLSVLGANCIYAFTNLKVSDLQYKISNLTGIRSIEPVKIGKESFFVKCFNCMFCPVNINEFTIAFLSNALIISFMEKRFGRVLVLKGLGLAYIGTVLSMLTADSFRRADYMQEPANTQIFNISLLFLFSNSFASSFSGPINIFIFIGLIYYLFYTNLPYDIRAGILMSFFLRKRTPGRYSISKI